MEEDIRDKVIETHTIMKRMEPLVEKHERDINRVKGIIAFFSFALTLLATAASVLFKNHNHH